MYTRIKRKRLVVIEVCGYILFGAILGKLLYSQSFKQAELLEGAIDLWERSFPIAGERGMIVDRDLEVLAMDLPSSSLMVVPSQIENKEETARFLSEVLEADYETILTKISARVSTQKLNPEGRLLDSKTQKKISDQNLKGVYLVRDAKRYYPKYSFLSQVLGFTGIDNQGLSGLELAYDSVLRGESGSLNIPFDALGNKIDLLEESWESSGKGNIVMLTISATIQEIMEREMDNVMLEYSPKQAWAIAMDPRNGEILAMVSKPDFDPNHYQEYDPSIYNHNLPIYNSYEPGSTFKVITFAMALNEGVIDMEKDTYMDRGYEMVNGARIKSWKAGGHGLQTFLEVLQNSSNPGFVEISRRLGTDTLYEYVMDFGFGVKTGVDLVGESKGIMFAKERMTALETATTAFGQGISLTALQLVRAVSATVNGGYLYEPYITKAILHPTTMDVLYEREPTLVRQVISEETSQKMRYALEHVVALGGGKSAYMEGYKIGGKTGTAQKVKGGGYAENAYILSFIGVAPIDDPKIVVYIAVDEPQSTIQYGGTIVAPIAKRILEDVLPYLQVEKASEQVPKAYAWNDKRSYVVPSYIGKSVKEISSKHHTFVYDGEGSRVISQLPSAGTKLEEGMRVWLWLGEDEVE
ncbi:MAG: stage V sporulation protein D [Erysipelotrichales bacterium]|nr:stage V sporulation protein D [Erysipelotrichales bacterium]